MKSFYDILEEALKGKTVIMRSYDEDYNGIVYELEDEDWMTNPTWDETLPYKEWQGTVDSILQNDNSHVDIIFLKDENHKYTGEGYFEDCYNWHMNEYIKII